MDKKRAKGVSISWMDKLAGSSNLDKLAFSTEGINHLMSIGDNIKEQINVMSSINELLPKVNFPAIAKPPVFDLPSDINIVSFKSPDVIREENSWERHNEMLSLYSEQNKIQAGILNELKIQSGAMTSLSIEQKSSSKLAVVSIVLSIIVIILMILSFDSVKNFILELFFSS